MPRSTVSQRSLIEEYFHMNSADITGEHPDEIGDPECFPPPHATVEPSQLLFYSGPSSQSVTITNHTKGKLSMLWTPADDSPFSITPLTCDLRPLKSTVFIVTYSPRQHNVFHAAQLECFILYKVQTSHSDEILLWWVLVLENLYTIRNISMYYMDHCFFFFFGSQDSAGSSADRRPNSVPSLVSHS